MYSSDGWDSNGFWSSPQLRSSSTRAWRASRSFPWSLRHPHLLKNDNINSKNLSYKKNIQINKSSSSHLLPQQSQSALPIQSRADRRGRPTGRDGTWRKKASQRRTRQRWIALPSQPLHVHTSQIIFPFDLRLTTGSPRSWATSQVIFSPRISAWNV